MEWRRRIGAFRSAPDTGLGFWMDSAVIAGFGPPNGLAGMFPPRDATELISPEQQRLNAEANRGPRATGTGPVPRR